MTPDQIELSRRAMSLPGAPKPPALRPYSRPLEVHMGASTRRDGAGILWVDVAAKDSANYDWLPDVRDPATGGVLVAMLGAERAEVMPDSDGYLAGLNDWIRCATLAEAACHVAIAVGRWAGGS